LIRIITDTETIDFLDREVMGIQVKYDQDYILQEGQITKPVILELGDTYRAVTVTFADKFSTTKEKIDKIIDCKCDLKLYYQYSYDPTVYIDCIHYPSVLKTYHYTAGEVEADITHTLVFLEI
jgi:hypothetical protein